MNMPIWWRISETIQDKKFASLSPYIISIMDVMVSYFAIDSHKVKTAL